MSKIEVDTIAPQSGTTVTLGEAGDSINVTPGTIKDSSGNIIISKSGTTVTLGASGDTVSVASGAEFVGGGIQWQSDIKTSAFTAVAGEGYWINTTSPAVTMTLPASASVGDTIEFVDYARQWGTNNVTINQNSLNYQGYTSPNPVYDVNGQHVRIVYSGSTKGWIPTVDDDVTDEVPQEYSVDFLVIAGGAGAGTGVNSAGSRTGGGGGAGGYRNSYSSESSGGGGSSETALGFSEGTVYTITVGAGGAGHGGGGGSGTDGSDSSISGSDITTITSSGGGAGVSYSLTGNAGGSGGGGGSGATSPNGVGGSGTANQGFDGGSSLGLAPNSSGGGGGAGEAGNTDGQSTGGDGLSSSITGSSIARGGGGGGGNAGAGGDGGGGSAPGVGGTPGQSGTANTGGGGGGSGNNPGSNPSGGSGGSGVVILRMATANYSGTTTGSPTVTTDGTDTILTYTGNGSYTG